MRLHAANPDLRDRLTAQRNERGDDLRERLSSPPNGPPAAPTNENCHVGQVSYEGRQVTPPEQGVTLTATLDVVTMMHLRNDVGVSENME